MAPQFYFRFYDFAHLGKLNSIPNFGQISQSTAEIFLLPVSENKRLPCWNSKSGSNFYVCVTIGVSFCICTPNFGEISQSMAEILLLPVSGNKRPPCWNFTPGSDFYVCLTIGMSLCISLPHFVQIRPSATELWRHIHFSRWRPSAILNYRNVTADHPRSANEVSGVLKFRLDQIYRFGDIAIFVLRGFGLKLPIYMVVSAAHAQNEGLIYFRDRNWPHILICRGRFAYSSSNFQRSSWSFKGCLLTKSGSPHVEAQFWAAIF